MRRLRIKKLFELIGHCSPRSIKAQRRSRRADDPRCRGSSRTEQLGCTDLYFARWSSKKGNIFRTGEFRRHLCASRKMSVVSPSLFYSPLHEVGAAPKTLSRAQADELFAFFAQHKLFNWKAANNGCEGRADAICVLLDEWGIPNYKGWAFGGAFLKKHAGELIQNWGYHVAPVLPVDEDGEIRYYILDPATGQGIQRIEDWAAALTLQPHSYYCIRQAHWYIFPAKDISKADWNSRNRQNRKWMIQALAGINGLTPAGKARLVFNKARIKATLLAFERARKMKPALRGLASPQH